MGTFSEKRQRSICGRKQVGGKPVTAEVSCCQGDLCSDLERHDEKNYFSNQDSSSNKSLNRSALYSLLQFMRFVLLHKFQVIN